MEWKDYKLSQLLTIKNGKDYKFLPTGDIPVFGSGGYMCSVKNSLYDGESILLPRKGSLNNIQYYNGAFWTVDTCFYSIVNRECAVPYYLYLYLKNLDLSGLDTGASIPSMTIGTYYGITIKLPSLEYQDKVANTIQNYDTLIDINTKRIKLLEESARELYKEWFVRMRFPGYENTKLVKGVPEGWKVGCLKDVSTLVSKKVKSGVIPIYVTTDNMLKDFQGIDYNELSEKPEGKVCEFEAGDILLSNIRPYFKKLWRANQRGGCSADVLVFRANKKIDQHFLYYTMCTESFIDYVVAGSNGTKMPRGNKAFTMNFPIIIPDKGVMDLFHKNVVSVYSIIETLQRQNLTLAATRDRLLPRLLSGNLEVKA